MTVLVLVAGVAGLGAIIWGLPRRGAGIDARIEPYLTGLHGRPSRLLAPSPAVGRLSRLARSLPFAGEDDLRQRLEAAGSQGNIDRFRLEQLTWAVAGAAGAPASLTIIAALGASVDLRVIPLLAGVCFVSGWAARDWWLSRQVARRAAMMRDELPVAIDLVTLSILSGESVPAAFERVSTTLSEGIGREFARTVGEVRAGSTVFEGLEAMSRRVDDPAMARFVDALLTGIEHGTSLAGVLRAQADDGRAALRRRLLESAGRREVLMLVPVVFLILPVVVLFALYPGLVSLDLLVP